MLSEIRRIADAFSVTLTHYGADASGAQGLEKLVEG
jgi:hypothetical protein